MIQMSCQTTCLWGPPLAHRPHFENPWVRITNCHFCNFILVQSGLILTGCNLLCCCSWGKGCCYHDSLLPDGEVTASCCQNNVFEEGRSLYWIHRPWVDTEAVERLGTCEGRETGRDWTLLYSSVRQKQTKQANEKPATVNPVRSID